MTTLILTIAMTGCKKDNVVESQSGFTVKGDIVQNNTPLAKASVSIDDKANYSTETDTNGHFEITGVPQGTHSISYSKLSDDGSFVQRTSSIDVTQDVILNSLRLPIAVLLSKLDSVTSSSVYVHWNKSDATDFREYKLFRNTSPGLDENTGTLVYVGTALNDTSFVETDLDMFTNYYYRVYVMNDYGKLGGSNIVNATTVNENIIMNGDFETVGNDSIPDGWYTDKTFASAIRSQRSKSGNYAMYIKVPYPRTNLGPTGEFGQKILSAKFSAGKTYTLTFWAIVDTASTDGSISVNLTYRQGSGNFLVNAYQEVARQKTSDWVKYSYDFTAPATTDDYSLDFLVWCTDLPYSCWIDDVQLKRKE